MQWDLSVPMTGSWDDIELIRSAVVEAFGNVYGDRESCELLGIVVGELLENAVKYGGADGDAKLRVVVDGEQVEIAVTNPVGVTYDDFECLLRQIHRLSAADPRTVYVERMKDLANGIGERGGGLGLARIASETGARLSVELNFQGFVRVSAVLPAPALRNASNAV